MKLRLCSFTLLCTVLLSMVAISCSKEETYSIVVPSESILLTMPGQSGTTDFDASNISSIDVTSTPKGWKVDNIDMYAGTITVTAPSTFDNEEEVDGTVSLKCYTPIGTTMSISIYVAILQNKDVDYTSAPANCYIASKPETRYKFNPYIGGSTTILDTHSVEILWESELNLIKYLDLRDGVASFYLESAVDDDDKPLNKVTPGNAIIGARNAAGEIIWSWHIWVTNSDPTAEVINLNGKTLMNLNLGADCNSEGDGDHDKIKGSYGLYYQWGRKDPFIGPRYWNFDYNDNEHMYLPSEDSVVLKHVASSAESGTTEWGIANPVSIILGNPDNGYDWLYSHHDDTLWSSTHKTDQDPCPAGWRVPDSSIYASLTITSVDDEMDWQAAQPMYGWHLEDTTSGNKFFFAAAGRRNYLDGRLDIVNDDPTRPIPWAGYYWTSSTDGDNSVAMFFDLNSATRTWNGFDSSRSMKRANAMPVRCVKE